MSSEFFSEETGLNLPALNAATVGLITAVRDDES